MPSSKYSYIPKNLDMILPVARKLDNQAILDIGCGYGKYGFLLREYLEMDESPQTQRFRRSDWKYRLDGVEAFSQYITGAHYIIYNRVIEDPISIYLEYCEQKYGLAIMIDVMEHFDKVEACSVLRSLSGKSDYVFFSMPTVLEQGTVFGNKLEAHRMIKQDQIEFLDYVHSDYNIIASDRGKYYNRTMIKF